MTVGELKDKLAQIADDVTVCIRACGEEYDYEDATIAQPFVIDFLAADGESIEKRPCFVIE